MQHMSRHQVRIIALVLACALLTATSDRALASDAQNGLTTAETVYVQSISEELDATTDALSTCNDQHAVPREASKEGLPLQAQSYDEDDEWDEDDSQETEDEQNNLYFALTDSSDISTAGIVLTGLRSGNVSYDENTGTLTLTNAQVDGYINLSMPITLELIGNSTISGYNVESVDSGFYRSSLCSSESIAITGNGTLATTECFRAETLDMDSAILECDVAIENSVTISGGTLYGDIICDSLVVSDGTAIIINEDYSRHPYPCIDCNSINISGGSIQINTNKDVNYYRSYPCIDCNSINISGGNTRITGDNLGVRTTGTFSMTGGSLTMTANQEERDKVIETPDFIMKGGTIEGDISTHRFTMSDGTVEGDVVCSDLTKSTDDEDSINNEDMMIESELWGHVNLSGGTVTGEIYCKGDITLQGGTVSNGLYATSVVMSNGIVKHGVSCSILDLSGGTISGGVWCGDDAQIRGGRISGGLTAASIAMHKGTIKGTVECQDEDWNSGPMKLSGGIITGDITASSLTMTKGTVKGKVECSGTVKLSGGIISFTGRGANDDSTAVHAKTLAITGGTIKASKCHTGIVVDKSLTVSEGKLTLTNCDYGIDASQYEDAKTAAVTIKGGTVTITNPSSAGVEAYYGNLAMTGGTLKVTGAYKYAIYAQGNMYRGKRYGGKVKITGGKVTACVRNLKSGYPAISADSISNKASCLAKVNGDVPTGTLFKSGGNVFKKTDNWQDVLLYSYGSSKTSATFDKVKFGGITYQVSGIDSGAFDTSRGQKVKTVYFKNTIGSIGASAFKGTKALTSLRIRLYTDEKWKPRGTSYTVKVTKSSSGKYNSKAFAGAGKNKGRGLTVRISGSREANAGYKSFLRKYGLPSGTKIGLYA